MAPPVDPACARRERIRHDLLAHPVLLLNRALRALAPPLTSPLPHLGWAALFSRTHRPSHLIIVLGVPVEPNGRIGLALQTRIDRAIMEAQADPAAFIVVTGAAVQNRWMEAQAMHAGLVSAGVDPTRIWVEGRATTTTDNAAQVWQLVTDQIVPRCQLTFDRVTVVAEPYHAMRALRIFAAVLGPEVPQPLLRLAAANRLPPVGLVRRDPRLAQDRTPLEQGQFLAVLSRCIEEKRRMMHGW